MENEMDIIEALRSIGYKETFLQENILQDALAAGQKSDSFRELLTWIAGEIHILRNTEEEVGKGTDSNEFMLELSAFLKELGCPYTQFISGPISSRLQSKESRILLLDYLITELMAMKMCVKINPQENSYFIPMFESSTALALQSITKELNLGKPPENISAKNLFTKIANRLDEIIKKTNPVKISQPLFKISQTLTDNHWQKLAKLQKELDEEYNFRRQMLLTRLDVTIQSFQWSEKMKGREDEIVRAYQKKKKQLDEMQYGDINTDIAALLAARLDLAIIEKTSSATVRQNTSTKIQKHVIGKVPDRGGRAYEHAPPPPEMPSWQQNRTSGPTGKGSGISNRGSGNRGTGGGGRGMSHNNWSQQQSSHVQVNNSGRFNQNQYDNRQQYEQRQQNDWSTGGFNRVQSGWSQRGSEKGTYQTGSENNACYDEGGPNSGSDNYFRGGNQSNNYVDQYKNHNYEKGRGSLRGRSSYNRGGGGRR